MKTITTIIFFGLIIGIFSGLIINGGKDNIEKENNTTILNSTEDVNSYNITNREGCIQIISDDIYNECIEFYNEVGLGLGDPLIGFRN